MSAQGNQGEAETGQLTEEARAGAGQTDGAGAESEGMGWPGRKGRDQVDGTVSDGTRNCLKSCCCEEVLPEETLSLPLLSIQEEVKPHTFPRVTCSPLSRPH